MNATRVFIDKGELVETVHGGPECVFDYYVARPLFRVDGSPVTGAVQGGAGQEEKRRPGAASARGEEEPGERAAGGRASACPGPSTKVT